MDPELHHSYLHTDYILFDKPIVIRLDKTSTGLIELMREYNAHSAAFISAANPQSQKLHPLDNLLRHRTLESILSRCEYQYLEGEGRSRKGDWPAERSFLVFDISLDKAKELGLRFTQHAIVFIDKNSQPELIWL